MTQTVNISSQTLPKLFPSVQDLLATEPEDLAPVLLVWARANVQNGMFQPAQVNDAALGRYIGDPQQPAYAYFHDQQIDGLLSQAWGWLERTGLIVRAGGQNGIYGWMMFTRKGEEVSSATDLQRIREAADFPKSLLHPSIAEKTWRAIMRNDLDDAVLFAFITVEDAVRRCGGFADEDIGVPLMRKAFNKDNGPLRDKNAPVAECEAMANLFAGAIGAFKNRRSHHIVNSSDLRAAQDRVLLASHLLRIVDSRRNI